MLRRPYNCPRPLLKSHQIFPGSYGDDILESWQQELEWEETCQYLSTYAIGLRYLDLSIRLGVSPHTHDDKEPMSVPRKPQIHSLASVERISPLLAMSFNRLSLLKDGTHGADEAMASKSMLKTFGMRRYLYHLARGSSRRSIDAGCSLCEITSLAPRNVCKPSRNSGKRERLDGKPTWTTCSKSTPGARTG